MTVGKKLDRFEEELRRSISMEAKYNRLVVYSVFCFGVALGTIPKLVIDAVEFAANSTVETDAMALIVFLSVGFWCLLSSMEFQKKALNDQNNYLAYSWSRLQQVKANRVRENIKSM
jgi:hypothetical protein